MAILRVRKGKQPGAIHAVYDSPRPTIIGREAGIDISLEDERASRRHARIYRAFGSWIVEDLGSSNGTLLSGQPLQRARLEDESLLQIGNTLLSFHEKELPPPPSQEVYGCKLLATLHEEGGVLVHRAFQPALDREVRIDLIAAGRQPPRAALETLERAIEDARRIQHGGIEPLLHAEIAGSQGSYAVLRCRAGEPLSACLKGVIAEPLAVRLRFFQSLADGLLSRAVWEGLRQPVGLHQVAVSRDSAGGLLASIPALELSALMTAATGGLAHLPAYAPYLAPECSPAAGELPPPAAFSSALYLLGAIGYQLFTGQPPMGEGPIRKTFENHRNLEPAPAHLLAPGLPEELSKLLSRLLAKDPAKRPAGRADVLAVLEAVGAQLEPAGRRAGASPAPAQPAAPLHGVAAGAASSPPPRRASPSAAARGRSARPASLGPGPPRPRRSPFIFLPVWIAVWILLYLGGLHGTRLLLESLNP
jgi:pSer/pThr/pTyr-binding forkhead associated (FHA) protein